MEKPIEDQQIPGLTVKNLTWFFGGVIAVIISVMGSAFSIKGDVKEFKIEFSSEIREIKTNMIELRKNGELRDADIRTIQLQIQTLQLQVARMEEKNSR